jgi:ABC-type branched-subunit amino acid transport system ATPase component
MTLLAIKNVTMQFGGLTAVHNVTFSVNAEEIVSVIGPNGAGKTTLFNMITGVYTPTTGDILIQDHPVEKPLSLMTLIMIMLSGIAAAIFLYFSLNIETLWEGVFTNHYIYQQSFPWIEIPLFVRDHFKILSWWSAEGTLLIGAIVGVAIAVTLWRGSRRTPELVLSQGLARTFQNIRTFPTLSVRENILVGMHSKLKASVLGDALQLPLTMKERATAEQQADKILELIGLLPMANLPASKLPYGHQRRLEIGRALASQPTLLLLDEPAAGMNPSEAGELMHLIQRIRGEKIAILLIEHHMNVVMGISDRIVVLDYGEKIAEGTPSEIRKNPEVIKAYLGGEEIIL